MAINFPSSPSTNDTHTDATSGNSWKYDGTKWVSLSDTDVPGGDADTVDSLHAASFLRSDAADTASGVLTINATIETTERSVGASSFDLSTGNHWTCGAITVPAPTNATAGTSGLIRITAAPTGWNTVFKFPGGSAPTISSFPALIPFYVQSSSVILMGNVAEGIS